MKKIFSVLMVLLFVSVSFAGTANHPNKEFGNDLGKDGRSYGDLYLKNKIIFEGATSNGYEGTISVPDVAADYTWTFPSKTGTIAMTSDVSTALKVGSNVASPAGGELDLGDGNYFYITGTNNITSIAAADATAGRMIILRFADILTFTDGNNLKLAGNLATSADDTITLMCDGTNCYEIARSVN